MFKGYLELGGVPLINSEATEAYLRHLLPTAALKPTVRSTNLHIANEEDEYRTPLLDEAPWANVYEPASHGFFGLYPLSIEGLDDDGTTASVTEFMGEGGSVGQTRRTTRPVRVSGVLVAETALGVQYGRDWLSAALRGTGCTDCSDGVLRYFVADPEVCTDGVFGPVASIDERVFGLLDKGIYRYRFPSEQVQPSMPMRARWTGSWQEGTLIRVGVAEYAGATEISSSDLIQPLRRNYAVNPSIRNNLTGYAASGAVRLTYQPDGGVDGASCAAARAVTAQDAGAFGTAPFGTAPFGGSGSPFVSTTTFPLAAGPAVVSLALRSDVRTPVTITASLNGIALGSTVVATGTEWNRISLPVTLPSGGAVAISMSMPDTDSERSFAFDQVMVERGAVVADYFDGITPLAGYLTTWDGGNDASPARRVRTASDDLIADNSRVRPFLEVLAGSVENARLEWDVRYEQGMDEQLLPYERNLFDVACTSGVKKIGEEFGSESGGWYMQVEFALVAGKPAPFSLPEPISTVPLANAVYTDPELSVQLQDFAWLADPNSIVVTLPPKAPTILNPAIETISVWRRYYVPIDAKAISDAGESVPFIALTSKADAINQVRVRFHPNPFGYVPTDVDPDSFCSEFVLSYLPANARLEVDGVFERAFASRGDQASTPADHLLYGTDGGPVSWPRLSCSVPYLMTVDVPVSGTIDSFDLEVSLRRSY